MSIRTKRAAGSCEGHFFTKSDRQKYGLALEPGTELVMRSWFAISWWSAVKWPDDLTGSVLHVANENLVVARQAVDKVADLAELLREAAAQTLVDQNSDLDIAGADVRE